MKGLWSLLEILSLHRFVCLTFLVEFAGSIPRNCYTIRLNQHFPGINPAKNFNPANSTKMLNKRLCGASEGDSLRSVSELLTNMSHCTLLSPDLYPTHALASFLDNAVIVKGLK